MVAPRKNYVSRTASALTAAPYEGQQTVTAPTAMATVNCLSLQALQSAANRVGWWDLRLAWDAVWL